MIRQISALSVLSVFLILGSCYFGRDKHGATSVFPENKSATIINDYSFILSEEEKTSLTKKIYDYEIATTNQIVFVSIDSISPYSNIKSYASALGNYWGVGQKDKDNGLIIVLCKPLREVGIATGHGTEKILTDSICEHVLKTTMLPRFRANEYYEGISNGLDSLMYKWDTLSKLDNN